MSTEVTLPALGESVTEGTVSRWLKAVGDTVEADEPLLEVSTDKVDTEVPSPASRTPATSAPPPASTTFSADAFWSSQRPRDDGASASASLARFARFFFVPTTGELPPIRAWSRAAAWDSSTRSRTGTGSVGAVARIPAVGRTEPVIGSRAAAAQGSRLERSGPHGPT